MHKLSGKSAVGNRIDNGLHKRTTTNEAQKRTNKVPGQKKIHKAFAIQVMDVRTWKLKELARKQKEQEQQEQKGEPKKKEEKKQPPPSPTTQKLDKRSKFFGDKYADKYPKSTFKPYKPDKEYRLMMKDLEKRKKSFPDTRKGRADFNRVALGEYRRYHMDLQENERHPEYKKKTDPETRRKNKQYIKDTKAVLKELESLDREGKKKLKEDKKNGTASDDTPEKWKEDKDKDATKVMSDNQPTMEGGDSKPEKDEKSDRPPFNALATLDMFLSHLKYDDEGKKKSRKEKQKEDREKMRAFIKGLEIEIKENPSDKKVQKANEGILKDLKKLFPPPKEKKKKEEGKGEGKGEGEKGGGAKEAGGEKGKKGGGGSAASKGKKKRRKSKAEEPSPHGHKKRRRKSKKGGDEEPSPHRHKKRRRSKRKGGDEGSAHGHKRRKRGAKAKKDDKGGGRKGKRPRDVFLSKLNKIQSLLIAIRRKRRRRSISKKELSKLEAQKKTLIKKLQNLIDESANDHKKAKIYHSERTLRREKRRIGGLQARLDQIEADKVNTRPYRIHIRKLKRKIRRLKKLHVKAVKNSK